MIDATTAKSLRLLNHTQKAVKAEKIFKNSGLSHNAWIEAYRDGRLFLENRPIGRNAKIPAGKALEIVIPDESSGYKPESIAVPILYEDPHILLIDKPEDLPMLPQKGETEGSLANRVQAYFNLTGTRRRIRFVNRLDRGTSGIVIVAKHKYMQAKLQRDMEEEGTEKMYLAAVAGRMEQRHMHIVTPLAKDPDSYRYIPMDTGKASHTEFEVIRSGEVSLLRLQLHTGRTHQIRAHLASIGFPILGDQLYEGTGANRMYLHAYRYRFSSWEGRTISVGCYPKDWETLFGMSQEAFASLL